MIELYRAIIPRNHIINDNHDQHYRIHQGNLDWLTRQFKRIKNNEALDNENVNFFIPSKNIIKINYPISIICEVWRPVNRRFDPQNYAKTFKAFINPLFESIM